MVGPQRGHIAWVDLGEPTGSAASTRGPCVVISNNSANRVASSLRRGVITVIPLTTNLQRAVHSHLILTSTQSGLPRDSAVQVEQIRAVDISRLQPTSNRVPTGLLEHIEWEVRVLLDLL